MEGDSHTSEKQEIECGFYVDPSSDKDEWVFASSLKKL